MQRFFRAFCFSNIIALAVALIPTASALTKDRRVEINAAKSAFLSLHSTVQAVSPSVFEHGGKQFSCSIKSSQPYCRFTY
jgi:hypothetical protein